jgi:hypothetical protein
MGFQKGNAKTKKHYWLTPPELFDRLNKEFCFDFDPCPFPKPTGYNGLNVDWGQSSYVNPPFTSLIRNANGKKIGITAWARKCIAEYKKGKKVVLVFPVEKWLLELIAAGAQVRNLGDVKWLAIEDKKPGPGIGRHIACFILDPGKVNSQGTLTLSEETKEYPYPDQLSLF